MNAQVTLLINKTDVSFITSDQPVINLKADYKDLSQQPDELVFYYPISPRVAMTINDGLYVKKIELTNAKDIYEYNDLINRAAYKMIFSNDTLKKQADAKCWLVFDTKKYISNKGAIDYSTCIEFGKMNIHWNYIYEVDHN